MQLKAFLLGGTVALCCAAPASAGHFKGWYIGLEGGGNWVSDNDAALTTDLPTPFQPATIEYDTGWAALATMGYGFEGNWRIEGELGYRQNDIDIITSIPADPSFPRTGGDLNTATAMVNVLYDWQVFNRTTLSFGAGAGAAHESFDDGVIGDDEEDWNFAYQGIVGLAYALSPRTDLTLNYRYLRTDESDFSGPHGAHNDFYALDDGEHQTVSIGLRFDLAPDAEPVVAAPPPVPVAEPPAPPPESPRRFIVFFGFDKSNLTSEAETVIREAAAAAKKFGSAQVVVVGHADTTGSPQYNQRLSERRANAVRDGLVAQGIDRASIQASGKGETELLVQTGDNVKEPQNRRANIDLQ